MCLYYAILIGPGPVAPAAEGPEAGARRGRDRYIQLVYVYIYIYTYIHTYIYIYIYIERDRTYVDIRIYGLIRIHM